MAAERLSHQDKERIEASRAALVRDCQAGDRRAQYRLYHLYQKAMFNTCLRMLKNREDAEDILQNSFVDVFTKLHSYRGDATIGAWIKRIVVNNCINHLKKKRIQLTEIEPLRLENMAETTGSEEGLRLNVAQIQKALYELPDGYRVTFSLYALEGYDHAEIAEIMGTSVSNSKSQYSRAKKKLRSIIRSKDNLIKR